MCDTLCVRTRAGMLFAKNSDRPPDEPQVFEAYERRPSGAALHTQYLTIPDPGAHALLGSRPTWLWGLEHGVNEYGVAIGNEKVWTIDDPRAQATGLLGMDLVRLGLERARSADDALDVMTQLLGEHGQGGSGERDRDSPYFSSFLIADANDGWVLETSGRTWAARRVGPGAAISNRLTLDSDWARASADVEPGRSFDDWRSERVPTSIADHRLAATRAAVQRADAVGPSELAATLRDHGGGPFGAPGSAVDSQDIGRLPDEPGADGRGVTVCMHVRGLQATTASMIAALANDAAPRAWVCLGSPCTGVYVPVFLDACPEELGDETQWQRFTQLRTHVEADSEALVDIRRVLGPVETTLWAMADDVWDSGEAGRRLDFAQSAWKPVDAALSQLGV
jgi:secernin